MPQSGLKAQCGQILGQTVVDFVGDAAAFCFDRLDLGLALFFQRDIFDGDNQSIQTRPALWGGADAGRESIPAPAQASRLQGDGHPAFDVVERLANLAQRFGGHQPFDGEAGKFRRRPTVD